MMSVDKTSTSKTEQSKQERLGEAIGLHTSNMVVRPYAPAYERPGI